MPPCHCCRICLSRAAGPPKKVHQRCEQVFWCLHVDWSGRNCVTPFKIGSNILDEYVPTQQELEQIFEHFDVHNEKSIAKLDSHEDDFDHFAITKDGPLTRSRTAHTSHQTKPSVIPVPNSDPEFPISPEFMGKRISKEFIDPDTGLLRPYTGIVKEFNSKTGKYRIHYPEDDDEEWMTSRKLTSFLDSAPSQSLNQPTDSTPVSIPPVVSDLDNQAPGDQVDTLQPPIDFSTRQSQYFDEIMPETTARTGTQYFDEVMHVTASDTLPSTHTYNMLKAYIRTASLDGKCSFETLSSSDAVHDQPSNSPPIDSTHYHYSQTDVGDNEELYNPANASNFEEEEKIWSQQEFKEHVRQLENSEIMSMTDKEIDNCFLCYHAFVIDDNTWSTDYAFTANFSDIDEPNSIREAYKHQDWITKDKNGVITGWQHGIMDELGSFFKRRVVRWIKLSDVPPDHKILSSRFVFKTKLDKNNEPYRWRARWVSRGFEQRENKEFFDNYASVCNIHVIKLLISLAVYNDWVISTTDVSKAFTYSKSEVVQYMDPPAGLHLVNDPELARQSGYELPPELPEGSADRYVLECQGEIYGSKSAAAKWFQHLGGTLKQNGFDDQIIADSTVYLRKSRCGTKFVLLAVVVDDLIEFHNKKANDMFENYLSNLKDHYDITHEEGQPYKSREFNF